MKSQRMAADNRSTFVVIERREDFEYFKFSRHSAEVRGFAW